MSLEKHCPPPSHCKGMNDNDTLNTGTLESFHQLTRHEKDLLLAFRLMEPDDQRTVRMIAESMANQSKPVYREEYSAELMRWMRRLANWLEGTL